MDDRLIALLGRGLYLLGSDGDNLTSDDIKIMRAFLAEGFYSFEQKNKYRHSARDDYSWMLAQAKKMGVNIR